MLSLVLGEGVVERTLHDVLQLDVEGGDEVIAVLCVSVLLRVDGHPATMVDSSHQLAAVLTLEVVVVGTFQAEIIALTLVGHTEHEAGEVLIGMLALDFLFGDEATFV